MFKFRFFSSLVVVGGIVLYFLQGNSMNLSAIREKHSSVSLAGKTAVVIGGTAGIGAAIAKRLAQADAHVVVVGRSQERGNIILNEMSALSKTAKHEFVQCDGKLLKNVALFTTNFKTNHTKLDYLVITQGIATFQGRTETIEGIDEKLSLHYYARIAFILGLAPLMKGDDARVLTVLSAGIHSPYAEYATDPELKATYSLANAANAACFYNDMAVESLSNEFPNISFIHAAPGAISTSWGTELPTVVRWLVRGLQFFLRSAEDCAEYMSVALLDPEYRGGWALMGQYGQRVPQTALHTEARAFVWEHTKSVLKRVIGEV